MIEMDPKGLKPPTVIKQFKKKEKEPKRKKKKEEKEKTTAFQRLATLLNTDNVHICLQNNDVGDYVIDFLCEFLIKEACTNDDCISIESILRKLQIPHRVYYGWVKKYPRLKAVHEEVKLVVAYHRLDECARKSLDFKTIQFNQHTYGETWRNINTYHAELRKKENSEEVEREINIYMDGIKINKTEEKK